MCVAYDLCACITLLPADPASVRLLVLQGVKGQTMCCDAVPVGGCSSRYIGVRPRAHVAAGAFCSSALRTPWAI